ncbi:undecaprenyldiphospho-muramoylpentapeptide beta-N-acetylglucosaminyltransferase [Afifella aestuarii]|uniref:undecaprenyldiphospho-muramoylpentapeptide beta-N-acetylglucosaminyltransferase n=1 Tax=Afifella aestuarii TaxID=1909496 RepID=UPI000FE3554C|nr:undecaprenyldiphospho-muramoylpentapeptide beta-N-acetylglucosaminyltransferase [Afifella aestuarii]
MSEKTRPLALLAAGGTGGHLFPAISLRAELKKRGYDVAIVTDKRAGQYAGNLPADELHAIDAATLSAGNPVRAVSSMWKLSRGVLQSRKLLRQLGADICVGFGGYPTVPPLLAARMARVPALVHEQNAVLGRANRLLVKAGAALATGFPDPKGAASAKRLAFTGNPVRESVIDAGKTAYEPAGEEDSFRLLVFGGSQGARALSSLVPEAVALLPRALRARLQIVQQCRPEDLDTVRLLYGRLDVSAELASFFQDLPAKIGASHLVISRAGASTVSELAVIGRPAILIPFPHAIDQDQAENARLLADVGGGWMMEEGSLTAEGLASRLKELIAHPDELAAAAAAAKKAGRPDAAERLADQVDELVSLTRGHRQ